VRRRPDSRSFVSAYDRHSGRAIVTSAEQIAAQVKCSIRQVNMTISLAFLALELVKAAVEGWLPRGIGVTRRRDARAE
jgi:hypothetical protein